ncbi:hypothetical protein Nepgr_017510 [Nepenthes gracilis]|uniref:Uncharacterized protein n=1 Tax=Nepenthes gracilis TaxID=150966 RepID=A0AAD3SRR0_NEPGR|nr:hypothetical protein Nepgr_017510 [Nepenthes gracilis]
MKDKERKKVAPEKGEKVENESNDMVERAKLKGRGDREGRQGGVEILIEAGGRKKKGEKMRMKKELNRGEV